MNGLFSSSSGAALVEDSKEGAEGDSGHFPGREAAEDDDDDVSESPTMGEDFYKGVEGLLSKPAPTLRHFCKTNGGPAGPSLPVLRKQRSDLRRGKPATGGAATTVGSKGEKRAAQPEPEPAPMAQRTLDTEIQDAMSAAPNNAPYVNAQSLCRQYPYLPECAGLIK